MFSFLPVSIYTLQIQWFCHWHRAMNNKTEQKYRWHSLALAMCSSFDDMRPEQNGRHFTDGIFRCIFENEQFCILIKISLKFVANDPIDDNPAGNGLAMSRWQAMTWTIDEPVDWCIYYVSSDRNGLTAGEYHRAWNSFKNVLLKTNSCCTGQRWHPCRWLV